MSQAITKFVESIGGAEIAGEEAGQGDAIMFIHAGVADRRMWRGQLAALSDRYRFISYDTRGVGQTTSPDEPFSYIEDLRALLDARGVARASLVGCSNGGAIAVDFALAWPERVQSLVLIAPGIRGAVYPEIESPALEALFAQVKQANESGDMDRVNALEAHMWLDGPLVPEGRVANPQLRELFLDMNATQLRDYPKLTKQVTPVDAYDRLNMLTMPTLVMIGEHDFDDIRALCMHLAETIPNARVEPLAGVAHLPSMERPALVNKLLKTFFAEVLS